MKTELDQYRDWLIRNAVGASLAKERALHALETASNSEFSDAADALEAAHEVDREIATALEYLNHYRDWQKVQKLV